MIMCMTPLAAPCNQVKDHRVERQVSIGKHSSMLRPVTGKRGLDICDSSNDSGLGFDNHNDFQHRTDQWSWPNESVHAKRIKLDIKLEDDETNDNFSFPETVQTCKDAMTIIRGPSTETQPYIKLNGTRNATVNRSLQRYTALSAISGSSHPISLLSQLSNKSSHSDICLRIVTQPEQQHRARYQTEGSRGAVKDRSGNGFPVVQLVGYCKPATLEVFIGTDLGKVAPHMFYQACRVSGKNSTACMEKKVDGTVVIEVQLDPVKDMVATCDCVGILKERNVDVEHRFPEQIGSRSKKKSTRCRMIFRTTITHDNGVQETLQVCSQPIVCTQPPGIPEICKKSLTSCPAAGGLELYILGKNFLKDTKVYFQHFDEQGLQWEQYVMPDKEYLQQTHLVCVVPPYATSNITEPVTVRLVIVSSGKTSEPHQFIYTPISGSVASVNHEPSHPTSFLSKALWSTSNTQDQQMMRPPDSCHVPLTQHRVSNTVPDTDVHAPTLHALKQEVIDENSQNSNIESPVFGNGKRHMRSQSQNSQGNSNGSLIEENSIDMLHDAASMDSVSQYSNDNSMSMMMRQNSQNFSANFSCNETENRAHELRVMDLRMKMAPVTVTLAYSNTPNANDNLAYTNANSVVTLQSFGVTEPTNTPLTSQTAQSIENYLCTLERKPVTVETMHLSQLLNSSSCNRNTDQSMSASNLLATTTQNLSHLGAINTHLTVTSPVCNFNSQPELLLQSQNGSITEPQANLAISIDTTNHTTHDILLRNRQSLISGSSQDIVTYSQSHSPLMTSSAIQNLPSEIIRNSQISPSLMCSQSSLGQENLLTNMCQTSPQILMSEGTSQQSSIANQLAPVMTATSENAILLNAAADLLETQNTLSKMDTLASSAGALTSIDIMNNILTSSHDTTSQMSTMGSGLQTSSIPSTLLSNPQLVDTVKDITNQIDHEKKNEDHMIPSGFATMTENELISIINPSCFDQGNHFHSM